MNVKKCKRTGSDAWYVGLGIELNGDEQKRLSVDEKYLRFFVCDKNGRFVRYAYDGRADTGKGEHQKYAIVFCFPFRTDKGVVESFIKNEEKKIKAAWQRWFRYATTKFNFNN